MLQSFDLPPANHEGLPCSDSSHCRCLPSVWYPQLQSLKQLEQKVLRKAVVSGMVSDRIRASEIDHRYVTAFANTEHTLKFSLRTRDEYTETVIENPDDTGKPTKTSRVYRCAEYGVDDKHTDVGLAGHAVQIEKLNGKYRITDNGQAPNQMTDGHVGAECAAAAGSFGRNRRHLGCGTEAVGTLAQSVRSCRWGRKGKSHR